MFQLASPTGKSLRFVSCRGATRREIIIRWAVLPHHWLLLLLLLVARLWPGFGFWLLAFGFLLLVVGFWLLVFGFWLLAFWLVALLFALLLFFG